MHLSPAEYAVRVFKGTRALARAVKRSPSAVCQWKKNSGNIPSLAQRKILQLARERDLDISPNDLVYGRDVEVSDG